MQVLKFGGSSVADATRMSSVMDIVEAALKKDRVILVASAVSGCTDALLAGGDYTPLQKRHREIVRRLFTGEQRENVECLVDKLFEELDAAPEREKVTYGELLSTVILARKFNSDGIPTLWIDSRELIKVGEDGKVLSEQTYANIAAAVDENPDIRLFVAPGFIASDEIGKVCTLGRGGSDYSAALYAAGSKADTLQIWTDVPGIMSANPKDIPSAQTIPDISYAAALDMAENGAKVLYAPTVRPAMDAGIAINIRNTFDPRHPGTLISSRPSPEGGAWMGVTALDFPEKERTRICLVGEALAKRSSAEARVLSSLNEAGISPLSGVYGEGSVFFIDLRMAVAKEALAAIHREFFESRTVTTLKIFIAGYGSVGKALVDLIARSTRRIAQRKGRSIRIVGISNSRKFTVDLRGIDPAQIESRIEQGESAAGGAFIDTVCELAPRKAIFIDCTDDETLYTRYEELMRCGLNIVSSNRRSLAIPYVKYAALKATARENGCFFRYDTTVGTSLPILESIASSANCSDEIESIEAVVSCTLNYIITNYDGTKGDTLAALLKRAQEEGLTEQDPRVDLGGRDVLRKLLILSREAGVALEEGDVEISPMLGKEFFDCDIDEFYRRLAEYEPQFIALEAELDEQMMRRRFVASLRKDPSARLGYKAEIKMVTVSEDSPFYWISGTENVTVVKSEYSAPLVIKGAGEGVKLAASGIIKDLLM